MNKSALRTFFKQQRALYVNEHGDRAQDFATIFNEYILDQKMGLTDKVIGFYYPFGDEASPLSIMEDLLKADVQIALPKMQGNHIVFAPYFAHTTLVKNRFGFYEPEPMAMIEPDILLIPLLAFDKQGHRLGYGKGHYDHAIRELSRKKQLNLIGIAFPCQEAESLPFEDHDQKLDAILLPDSYRLF